MRLSYSNELGVGSLTTHNVSPWRKYTLNLLTLAHVTLHAAIGVDGRSVILRDLILGVT